MWWWAQPLEGRGVGRGGGERGEGKEVGWSRLGDRRHHLSQQTNNVCRRDNKVVAAQQQSGFQADRRLDKGGRGGGEGVVMAAVVVVVGCPGNKAKERLTGSRSAAN